MISLEEIDRRYEIISSSLDWDNPSDFVSELRYFSEYNHSPSMNLLAVILEEIDKVKFYDEIVSLYRNADKLGSPVAADNLAKFYQD